ncbi:MULTISPECIES: hypothetical protein [Methylomonas]|uniref:Uncharacterized protein n=2 Tax=Methylomonas TaxID=416 RepID=A0A140E5G5_9GAMM|nr:MULTISPECIES: hypothetical protein [Methylomonas]AMK75639.1 hypothetical protein JT25_003910 [Methylomonas denitrificans]OAH96152.1 hypothetical protein A1342_06710 [Methylomonas methanica]TCV75249.1 hypothetical protein EDE11_13510 [Methylomonas methanica]
MADDQLDPNIQIAIHSPHNIMIADSVLDIKISGFNSTITLGYTNPAGIMQPAVTLLMPTDKMHDMAHQISNKVKSESKNILDQHKKFVEKLNT